MSVFNEEEYLKESLESVLGQSFREFEFLICDDSSSDTSSRIISGFTDKRIKFIRNKTKLGLTKSLNKLIKMSRGEYIARMDADDISLPERFKIQTDFLDKHHDIAIVGSWAILINTKGRKLRLKKTPIGFEKIRNSVVAANPFIHPTVMYRKKTFEKIGIYNEKYIYAQDYELILRLLKGHLGANIDKPLILYRVANPKSISNIRLKQQEIFALKARLEAITKMGYPIWNSVYLIKPLLSYLVPAPVKIRAYQRLFWNQQ